MIFDADLLCGCIVWAFLVFYQFKAFRHFANASDLVMFWRPLLCFLLVYLVSKVSEITPTDLDHPIPVN